MTPQARWQSKKMAAGECAACGLPRGDSLSDRHCAVCHGKATERKRAAGGFKPWRPGGPGRPPKRGP